MRALVVVFLCSAVLCAPAVRADTPVWVVTLAPTTPYASMADDAEALPPVHAQTILQLVKSEGDWSLVHNPRTNDNLYVDSSVLAPSDPPSRYLTLPAPPLLDEFSTRAVVTDNTSLALF